VKRASAAVNQLVRRGDAWALRPVEVDCGVELQDEIKRVRKINGTRAAAWFVNRFRYQIRKHGIIVAHMPEGKDAPTWFRYALAELRSRDSWTVCEWEGEGSKRYEFVWTPRQ